MRLDSIQDNGKVYEKTVGYMPLRYYNNMITYPSIDGDMRFYIGERYNAVPSVVTTKRGKRYYDGYHCFMYRKGALDYIREVYKDNTITDMRVYYCELEPPYTHGYIHDLEVIVSSSVLLLYDTQFSDVKDTFIRKLDEYISTNAGKIIGDGALPEQKVDSMDKFVCRTLTNKFLNMDTP